MEEKTFIFGITDLAEILLYHLLNDEIRIDGFMVHQNYKHEDFFHGFPVYEYELTEKNFPGCNISVYVCIGYSHMNYYRRRLFQDMRKKNYHIKTYIHKSANVFTKEIGEGNLILECAYIGMYARIGDGNIFYPKCVVAHHASVGSFNYFSIACSIAGKVMIGNENFFGNNAATKDKIKIANRILVGAGAYVDRNLKDNQVIVPQKSIVLTDKNSTDLL